jgi:hypothetical protein
MSRDYDEQTVDLVRRTLAAVAEVTPIGPPRPGELAEVKELTEEAERVVPLVRRQDAPGARRTPPRHRVLAVAAAVLAVVLAVTAAWLAESDRGQDAPPANRTGDGALPERIEPGWLPDPLAGTEPERTATLGVRADPDAAVLRPASGDGVVVATTDADDTTADTVAAALARITQADLSDPVSGQSAVRTADGRVVSIASSATPADGLAEVIGQVRDGARPADVAAPGWTTTPVTVGWVPGIARSDTVRYGGPFTGPWVELGTTVGQLPEPAALEALLPLGERVQLGDREAWALSRTGASAGGPERSGTWTVVWQEADGLVGSVTTSGVAWDDVQRIGSDARLVDDPAPAVPGRPRVVADGEAGGTAYAVEAWVDSWHGIADGAAGAVCWRVQVRGGAAAVPTCEPPSVTFNRYGDIGGRLVLGAVVSPDVTDVRVEEGTVESAEVVSVGAGRTHLALVVATEEDAHNAMVSFVGTDGQASQPTELLFE